MLLPHLANRSDVSLAHVATNRSLSALNAQRKFGFDTTSTDAEAVLADDSIDAVFIVTRHSSHAALTCRALEAGKAVFVEKPMALSLDDVECILATVDATGNDRLMVGFNRRFSPMLTEMRSRFGGAPRRRRRPVPRQCRPAECRQLVRRRLPGRNPVRGRRRTLHRHRQLVDRLRSGRRDGDESGRPRRRPGDARL